MPGYSFRLRLPRAGEREGGGEASLRPGALGERLPVLPRAILPRYGTTKGTITCIIDKPGRAKVTRPAVIATVPCSAS